MPTTPPPTSAQRRDTAATVSLEKLRSQTSTASQMVCLIFVAGHDDLLQREIAADRSGRYEHLRGVPKALLPASAAESGGDTILGRWWREVNSRQLFNECYLVTNAHQYKHFERWATANSFPVNNIINDGTTTHEGRLGAAADLDLVLRSKGLAGVDAMVLAGDMIFSQGFDISGVQRFARLRGGDVAVYYELSKGEDARTRGLLEVEPASARITALHEKPHAADGSEPVSRLASVVFYVLRASTLEMLPSFLEAEREVSRRSFGRYFSWLVHRGVELYGMKIPTAFDLIGQTSLAEYEACTTRSAAPASDGAAAPITRRAHARVGLLGNPSDGFFGKTIAVSLANFWAEVTTERLVGNGR